MCIDTECNDLLHRDARLVEWDGESEGQNRAGGMLVHTSPLAGLLHVSNKVATISPHIKRALLGHSVQHRIHHRREDRSYYRFSYYALCAVMHGLGW